MHHSDHDLDLIAGFAADDLTATERARADAQLGDCPDCSALRDDLLAIARAIHDLPAQAAPNDYRITAEQAARLRRTSWVARFLVPIAGAGSVAKPLAATFTTLGLVGVFVAAALPGMLAGGASTAAPEAAPVGGEGAFQAATAGPAPQYGPFASTATDQGVGAKDNTQASNAPAYVVGSSSGGGTPGAAGGSTDGLTAGSGDGRGSTAAPTGSVETPQRPPNVIFTGSVVMLGVGLALFGLRVAGRRLR